MGAVNPVHCPALSPPPSFSPDTLLEDFTGVRSTLTLGQTPHLNPNPDSEPLNSPLLPPQAMVVACLAALSCCGFKFRERGVFRAGIEWVPANLIQVLIPSLIGELLSCFSDWP